MQLIIRLMPEKPLTLPLAYHHLVQSALYDLMKEEGLDYSIYHEKKPADHNRSYGKFTFGKLHGAYRIREKQIIFQKDIVVEVRSTDLHCLELIREHAEQDGFTLAGQTIRNVQVR
ncbi:MAG: hypothetical protein MJ097_02760, partial [Dorea sp.]|nr:hypothetical protein [Dorea sp.]